MTSVQHISTFADLQKLLDSIPIEALDKSTRLALQRARRALLQQTPPGRTPINDAAALRQVDEHMAEGLTFHAAAKRVARNLARDRWDAAEEKSVVERLRRKAKKGSTK